MSVPISKRREPAAPRGRRAARRSARHAVEVPRVVGRAEDLVVGLEVAATSAARWSCRTRSRPRRGRLATGAHRRSARGRSAHRAAGGPHALRPRYASLIVIGRPCSGPSRRPRRRVVGRPCRFLAPLEVERDDRVDRRVQPFDPRRRSGRAAPGWTAPSCGSLRLSGGGPERRIISHPGILSRWPSDLPETRAQIDTCGGSPPRSRMGSDAFG